MKTMVYVKLDKNVAKSYKEANKGILLLFYTFRGSDYIIPVAQALAFGQSINLHSAFIKLTIAKV